MFLNFSHFHFPEASPLLAAGTSFPDGSRRPGPFPAGGVVKFLHFFLAISTIFFSSSSVSSPLFEFGYKFVAQRLVSLVWIINIFLRLISWIGDEKNSSPLDIDLSFGPE